MFCVKYKLNIEYIIKLIDLITKIYIGYKYY